VKKQLFELSGVSPQIARCYDNRSGVTMAAAYWHHDDFLFEKQFPTTKEPTESPITAGDELLKRCLQRLRRTLTTREPQPQSQPQSAGVKSYYPEIGRTFHPNPKRYAKHPFN
jgi:hypothetical protein